MTRARVVAWAILGLTVACAVALALLFTSPPIDCSAGTCQAPSTQEAIALPLAAGCAVLILLLGFLPAARPWRAWLLAAGIPLAAIAALWAAQAAGASLAGLDRPVVGPDAPCNDTDEGSKCAGDPFTWGTILLVAGYAGLACLAIACAKALVHLVRGRKAPQPSSQD